MERPASKAQERSRLVEASMLGEKDKVKSFAKKDRDSLDQGDRRGFTAYHHACANGHAAVVKALLKAGCDTAAVNDSGRCAPVPSRCLRLPPADTARPARSTGWALAREMKRAEVQELLAKVATKGSKKLALEAKLHELEARTETAFGTAAVLGGR